MPTPGSADTPLRVAIIGAGPAGFYTISNLLKHKDLNVEIDLFDRLPTPFGLVRAGVAPDHQKDKSVTRAYAKSAEQDNVRFYGNVEYGKHIHLADLQQHYHQVVFTNGAPNDRDLGIPGEDLAGSHSATDFVAWYNGHPDFADLTFDLSQEAVAIVGVGNVAMDVARILCHSHAELAKTDIADHALAALRNSKVKRVYMLGRRGPAQAAFTPPEIKEFGDLEEADVTIAAAEAQVDALSRAYLDANPDKNAEKNLEIIASFSDRVPTGRPKLLTLRFLVSPTEILGEGGRVSGVRLMQNAIFADDSGAIRPKATGREEILPVGLVFRSVGYKGVALESVPFDAASGTIRNVEGRVIDEAGKVQTGMYTAGWIKRGPTGVIGTNKTCAQETVNLMVEDLAQGACFSPTDPSVEGARALIASRQPDIVSYADWTRIDEAEIARGEAEGRPRVKFTRIDEMLAAARG